MKFSLVIPVAPKRDAPILDSIKNINFPPKKFEVIVEKGSNASENRNRGLEKAKGEFIVFLDDDAFIKEDYLKELEEFLKKYPDIDIVGGPQLSPKQESLFEKISGIALTSNFGAFKVNKRYFGEKIKFDVDETSLTSCNLCARKKSLEKIGGFNTKLFPGEDPELIQRAKKNHLKIAYNPKMIVYHKRRANLILFCKQIFKYGVVRPKINQIIKQFKLIFIIPMLFSIYVLFLFPLSLINKLLFIPFLVYIVLAAMFAIVESIKNKEIKGIFLLPPIYFATHVSYGLGVLTGYLLLKDD